MDWRSKATANRSKLPTHARTRLSNLESLTFNFQNLPETANRVETRVSYRKQTTGYLSTRDSSRDKFRPISERIATASAALAPPSHSHNQARRSTLTKEAFARAKDLSNLESLRSDLQNSNRYTERLETAVSHRKQPLGTVLIGTDPVSGRASNLDAALSARAPAL